MAQAMISKGEAGGLVVALALHAAIVALLVMRPAPRPLPEPERMTVTLADDVGLEAVSPSKQEAAPDLAPALGEQQVVPKVVEVPKPVVKPVPAPLPAIAPPKPEPVRIAPKAAPKPEVLKPKPVAKVEPVKPAPKTPAKAPAKPEAKVDPVGAAIAAAAKNKALAKTTAKARDKAGETAAEKPTKAPVGGSKIGADFLKGAGSSTTGKAQTPQGKVAGPAVQSALKGAITRQLKPYWRVPQGVDTEQLVTVLRFSLNRDGTLAGPITVVRQEGVNDSNRAQAPLHKENAMRAVKLAAPFPLPPDYYDSWKQIEWNFNRNLAQ